jgi:hypothetical protein
LAGVAQFHAATAAGHISGHDGGEPTLNIVLAPLDQLPPENAVLPIACGPVKLSIEQDFWFGSMLSKKGVESCVER